MKSTQEHSEDVTHLVLVYDYISRDCDTGDGYVRWYIIFILFIYLRFSPIA